MTEPRRFQLHRDHDISGVSGTGIVADGVVWPDGAVAIRWRGDRPSSVHWDRLDDAKSVHGHSGATRFVWLDIAGPPQAAYGDVWAELRGYVQEAVEDGGIIRPDALLAYLDELKRKALAPIREWMDGVSGGNDDRL